MASAMASAPTAALAAAPAAGMNEAPNRGAIERARGTKGAMATSATSLLRRLVSRANSRNSSNSGKRPFTRESWKARRESSVEFAKAQVRELSCNALNVERLEKDTKRSLRASIQSVRSSRLRRTSAAAASRKKSSNGSERTSNQRYSEGETSRSSRRSDAEPDIRAKEDVAVWVAWAQRQAEMHAHFVHPRVQVLTSSRELVQASTAAGTSISSQLARLVGLHKSRGPVHVTPPTDDHAGEGEEHGGEHGGGEEEEETKMYVPRPLPLACTMEQLSSSLGVGVRLYLELLRLLAGLVPRPASPMA